MTSSRVIQEVTRIFLIFYYCPVTDRKQKSLRGSKTFSLYGIQEVSGSIPLISTKNTVFSTKYGVFSNFFALFMLCYFKDFSPITDSTTDLLNQPCR